MEVRSTSWVPHPPIAAPDGAPLTPAPNCDVAGRDDPSWPVKIAVVAAIVGVMAVVRLGVFQGRVMPIAFGMPLVVFVWVKDRRLLWLTAAIFAATTIVEYAFFTPIHNAAGATLTPAERFLDVAMVLLD